MAKKTVSSRKRVVVVEANGMGHVHSSFNNIIVTLTNMNGEVISWSSAGKKGSVVQKRTLRMQLRLLRKNARKPRMTLDFVKLKCS